MRSAVALGRLCRPSMGKAGTRLKMPSRRFRIARSKSSRPVVEDSVKR
jgi:hypothetical protein